VGRRADEALAPDHSQNLADDVRRPGHECEHRPLAGLDRVRDDRQPVDAAMTKADFSGWLVLAFLVAMISAGSLLP